MSIMHWPRVYIGTKVVIWKMVRRRLSIGGLPKAGCSYLSRRIPYGRLFPRTGSYKDCCLKRDVYYRVYYRLVAQQ